MRIRLIASDVFFYIGDGNEGGIGGGYILARLHLGQLWWVFN